MAPAVCAGRVSGVGGVRGRGSSVWGEVQGRQEGSVGGAGCRVCEGKKAGDGSLSAHRGGGAF